MSQDYRDYILFLSKWKHVIELRTTVQMYKVEIRSHMVGEGSSFVLWKFKMCNVQCAFCNVPYEYSVLNKWCVSELRIRVWYKFWGQQYRCTKLRAGVTWLVRIPSSCTGSLISLWSYESERERERETTMQCAKSPKFDHSV